MIEKLKIDLIQGRRQTFLAAQIVWHRQKLVWLRNAAGNQLHALAMGEGGVPKEEPTPLTQKVISSLKEQLRDGEKGTDCFDCSRKR